MSAFPILSRCLDCTGPSPPPVAMGPCTAFSGMRGAPKPVGPVAGGGVQRFAEGQQGVSSRTLPLWLNRVFSAVLAGAVCRFVCDLMPLGLRVFLSCGVPASCGMAATLV